MKLTKLIKLQNRKIKFSVSIFVLVLKAQFRSQALEKATDLQAISSQIDKPTSLDNDFSVSAI
jgi:hypothetical protein